MGRVPVVLSDIYCTAETTESLRSEEISEYTGTKWWQWRNLLNLNSRMQAHG